MPVELPVEKPVDRASSRRVEATASRIGPLVAPAPTQLPRRHYFVVAKSPRGRESVPSTPVSVPLEAGQLGARAPVVTNTATEHDDHLAAVARCAHVDVPVAADREAGRRRQRHARQRHADRPPPLPPLAAKSLGFNTQATTYHVYDVTPPPTTVEPDPYAIKLPAPITPAPVADTEYVIKGVAFGVERCFEVRPVDQVFGATVIGPASPRTCVTPKDTFPPAAPTIARGDRRRRRHQPDLGREHRKRSGRLHRVARRSAR